MSRRASKNIKEAARAKDLLTDLTPVSCEAVTAFKIPGTLLSKSVSLTIVNGIVTKVNILTPAENTTNIVISKAVKSLWRIIRGQTLSTFLGDT